MRTRDSGVAGGSGVASGSGVACGPAPAVVITSADSHEGDTDVQAHGELL